MSDNYADAVDSRYTAIGGEYNPERNDPIPSDLLEKGWRYDHNGELLAPGEPDPVVVPEEVDE